MGLLLALGTWQVERLAWKEGLLARITSQLAQPPVALATVEAAQATGEPIEYRPVSLTGTFLHDRERHFFATYAGQSGFYVYTPLRLADGRVVFVNRGFVPYDRKNAATRAEGQVEGEVTITGLARERLDGKPSWLVPTNDPAKNIFYWKDLDAMAASAGISAPVLPFFVDANTAPNPGGLPVGGVTIIDLPNNHLQYAVTWYGLALALAGICVAMWLRRNKPADST
ncbi:SURF1 family protein [Tianweitania sp. BSSL-BM11]|uniref:SURF1-like protein n=1 Tax=Tianweitania aestuarii TaxID=2814886 RepID=A0ABS5RRV2_9HYPH|nr:SURF1 family protein [Tianweitania aestuarii]MBS9719783.1 SURF1 family protein [Tianweitania aestuarii]